MKKHGRSPKTCEAFIEMQSRGRIPTGRAAVKFWLNILYYLQGSEDKRFESMVQALEEATKADPSLTQYLNRFRK